MNTMSLREKAVLASVAMVVLYGFAALVWFLRMDITNRNGEWYKARRGYQNECRKYHRESQLIADRGKLEEEYDAEKSAMPTFATGMSTDTTWLEKIGEIATKHHVEISSRKPGKEIASDDVMELSIDYKWEGSLEALVRFMHELENTDQGMFDFSSLSFKPSARRGYLVGSFTVTCAYMRE